MDKQEQNMIIYHTADGKAAVSLYAKDGMVWMNQNQLAELFDTSKQNIGQHIATILKDNELEKNSVVKNYFTTASDGKKYNVTFYALEMILAIGFRVRSKNSINVSPPLYMRARGIPSVMSLSSWWRTAKRISRLEMGYHSWYKCI